MTGAPAWRAVHLEGAAAALAAAALFGVSAPLAKMLLPGTGPLPLAAFLYLGAGLGLVGVGALARGRAGRESVPREARLRPDDLPLLAVVIVAGGIAGPVLMLLGLQRVSAVAGSLLLNLEAPLTILLAVVVFGEHLGRRGAVAAVLIALGAALLGYLPGLAVRADWRGVAAIVAACLGWAIDNNATQRLSVRDPVAVARMKGLGAGACTLALAVGSGVVMPPAPRVLAALALGFVSYGLSVVLAVRALRILGAARQAALFATAPFVGAVVAVPLLDERFGLRELAASALMALGVTLLLGERHLHAHRHERLEHDHVHVHDEHHRHGHDDGVPAEEPHAHPHVHAPLTHTHAHVSDVHHRHRH
jgi:drug/metabolite transporter (DMT)-like permease